MSHQHYYSFKELDQALECPKGTGFRLFKVSLSELREGRDFHVLHNVDDVREIDRLKADGRIYAQSVNVVLLSRDCFERLLARGREQSR